MKRKIAVATSWLVIIAFILSPLTSAGLGRAAGAEPFPTPETAPVDGAEIALAGPQDPPVPGSDPQIEQARARQAMEDVLEKYLAYWGPRYQLSLGGVAVEGEWAHAVTTWQSEARVMGEPLHILAHRSPSGLWQAAMPDGEGVFLQWLEVIPDRLLSSEIKGDLRALILDGSASEIGLSYIMYVDAGQIYIHDIASSTERVIGHEFGNILEYTVVNRRDVNNNDISSFVTVDPGYSFIHGIYTPDGSSIVYLEATCDQERCTSNSHIWIIDIHTHHRQLLFSNATSPRPELLFNPIGYSSIQNEIYFDTINPRTDESFLGIWRLSVDNPIGLQEINVGNGGYNSVPLLSPDGRWLLMTGFNKDSLLQMAPFGTPSNMIKVINLQDNTVTIVKTRSDFSEYFLQGWVTPNNIPVIEQAASSKQIAAIDGIPEATSGFQRPMTNYSSGYVWLTYAEYACGYVYHPGWDYNGLGSCNDDLYTDIQAVADGQVVYRNTSNWGGMVVQHLYQGVTVYSQYGHILSGLFAPGDNVSKGAHIAELGNVGATCAHLHWEIRESDHPNPSYGAYWDCNVLKYMDQVNNYYEDPQWWVDNHGSYGTSCPAPSLISPADGQVMTSRSVTFSWNALSGCTYSGYTLRVKDVPDMDSGGTTIYDQGVGETSRTVEFLSQWDNKDLYWGVRAANAPSGAAWAVRRFRIEPYVAPPCSPTSDQISLYADPNFTGACITLGVGNYPDPGYLGSVGNDNVESIRVGSNVQAILYEHAGYEGRSEIFTADDSNLSDNPTIHNNEVSSVKVQWRTVPPAAPVLSTPANGATFEEGASITLTWNPSPTASEYYVEYWGGPAGTLNSGWLSNTYWSIGSQWAGYTYSWRVKAHNSAGDSVWSATWTFTVRPAAPTNLTAQTASCSQANLYWTDNSGNEEGYKIYRNGALIAQVGMNVTSYQNTGLSENTFYTYNVKAYRGSIESLTSNYVYVTTPYCAPSLPDLRPYVPSGYTYPVTPASIPGTSAVNTLLTGQDTYFDWFFANTGTATASGSFYVELWVDDTLHIRYPYSDYSAGWSGGFTDWTIPIDTPGWHTVSLITDPDNTIAESDEENNLWQRQFYWASSVPFVDLMEDGSGAWTTDGLWHMVDEYTSPYPRSYSWSHSWWYGQDATGDYDTGARNSGSLTSPVLYIPSSDYYLRFWYWYDTETQSQSYDQRWVQISVNGGAFTNVLQLYDDPWYVWLHSQYIDLSAYAGDTIQVRFFFDSIDGSYNDYRGWYIDDVSITTDPPPSCSDANEPNDSSSQATPIGYGQVKPGDICPNGDYDYFSFYGLSGERAVIDIDAMSIGSWLDPYAFLIDSDGTTILGENDDEILGEVRDSKLGYQLPHDGSYYVQLRAWNHPSAGGAAYYYDFSLYQDDQLPTAQITSPVNLSWMGTYTETVTVAASDVPSGVQRVEYLWHSADWSTSDWVWLGADEDGRDGWSWLFDTSSLPDQQGAAFYIWAFDWAGNWIGAGVWDLGIDRIPPVTSLAVSAPYSDAPFLDFHVYWQGSDDMSGVAAFDIQVRDGADGVWLNLLTNTTDRYYHYIGEDGHTYYFRARARDWAGNQSDYAGGDGDAQYLVAVCPTPPDSFEADDSSASARWIYPDAASQIHNFHLAQDEDWLKFSATAGTSYTLATTNSGGHADTVLYLYDTNGTTLLTYNDDYPEVYPASRIDWQPVLSGVYYLMVNHWDPWAYGCTTEYNLAVTTAVLPPATILNFLPFIRR